MASGSCGRARRSGYRHVYLYDLEGKELAQLTKGNWEVAVQGVDEAKGIVYFTATEKSPLERHCIAWGWMARGFARITKEDGTHAVQFAPGAGGYVDTYSNSMNPPRQDLVAGGWFARRGDQRKQGAGAGGADICRRWNFCRCDRMTACS